MSKLSRRDALSLLGIAGVAPLAGGLLEAAAAAAGTPATAAHFAHPITTDPAQIAARKRIQEQHLPNLPLINHEGKRVLFYEDLVKNKVVSINFFYAKCDEICPLVLANLAKVQKLLGDQVGRQFFMYSITLKPEEDNVDVVRNYRESWHAGPGWTFFTGKPADIEKIRKGIGFTYPDPAIDNDKTQHIGNIRYGNEPLMYWAACPGMAHAKYVAETLEWMIHPR
jgi:protein SCO1